MGTLKINNSVKTSKPNNSSKVVLNKKNAAVLTDKTEEIASIISLNIKIVRDKNGKKRKVISAVPQYYKDKNSGKYLSIDTALKEEGTKYVCDKNNFKVEFDKESCDGRLYELSKDKYSLALYFKTANKGRISHSNACTCKHCEEQNKVSVVTSDGTKIIYESLNNSIKENIIVSKQQEKYEYNFVLSISGLTVEEGNNNLLFKDAQTGTTVFMIPAPYMYDAKGVRSDDVSYEVDVLDNVLSIKVVASSEFINSNDRVFPVTIDPQIIELLDDMWSFSTVYTSEYGDIYADGGIEVGPSDNLGVAKTTIFISSSEIPAMNDENIVRKYLVLHKETGWGKVKGHFLANGVRYSGEQDIYEIDITNSSPIVLETDKSDPLQGGITFASTGENAPTLVLVYPIDIEDSGENGKVKHVPYKLISLGDSVAGHINLKNSKMVSAVKDIIVGKSLPINIKHIHNPDWNHKGCYGYNWKLNLDTTLKASSSSDKITIYTYVDELGDEVILEEKYYYIKNSFKILVDKKDVEIDINGKLSYDGYEVRTYQANDDVMLISEIKDFVDAELIDVRQNEQIQIEGYINSCKQNLANVILVNTIRLDKICSVESLGIENFESEWEKYKFDGGYAIMTETEYLQLTSIKDNTQLELLNKQIKNNTAVIESYMLNYRKNKAQLTNYISQTPVNYIRHADGIIKGFNSEGKLVCFVDKNNNCVVVMYNSDGNISELYEGDEKIADFVYDNGLLHSITDSRGRVVQFGYEKNKSGDKDILKNITYPDESSITLNYSSNCITPIDYSNGLQYKPSYKNGEIKSLTIKSSYPTNGTISDIDITQDSDTVTIFNKTAHETEKFVINQNNNIVKHIEIDSYGVCTETLYSYENVGLKETVTTSSTINNQIQQIVNEYDDMNTLISKTQLRYEISENLSVESVTKYIYDLNDKLISEITTVIYTDDKNEEVKRVVNVSKYHYDAQGRLVLAESYVENEELITGINYVKHVFDAKGREIKTISWNSLDSTSKFYSENKYSDNGLLVAENNEDGTVAKEYDYVDGSNFVNSVTYANGSKFAYGRDPNNDITTSITQSTDSGESNTTDIVYKNGLPIKVKSGDTEFEYEYDYARRKTSVSVNGQKQYSAKYNAKYSFNAEDDYAEYGTITETLHSGNNVDFVIVTDKYGPIDEETSAVKLIESITVNNVEIAQKQYDGYRRLIENKSGNLKIVYQYDDFNHVVASAVTKNSISQITQNYEYDAYGSLTIKNITGEVNQVYSYYYKDNATHELDYISLNNTYNFKPSKDVNGRYTGREIYAGENKIAAEYISYRKVGDHATKMPSTVWFGSGSEIKESLNYKYDLSGNICEIRENGDLKVRYSYDALGRLSREDNRYCGTTFVFSYDNNGNIKSRCEYTFTMRPNDELDELECTHYDYTYEGDRLKSYNGETFVYNNLGSPTTYRGTSATWLYGKFLESYKGVNFTYNGLGNRASKGTISFTYDDSGRLIKQSNGLEFFYDNANVAGFIYGNNEHYFYRKDAQGNVIAILDNAGNVVVKYAYDAWGNNAIFDANGEELTDTNNLGYINPFRYRGYYYDVETGLYFLQTRYYDPETGRFISQDSLEYADPTTVNGLNLYAYCGNNPVMNIDPTGTFFLACVIVGLIIGAVVGGVIGGVTAAQNGATGWELVGAIYLGIIIGGNIGGIAGALIGVGIPMISSGLGAIGGAGGIAALAGGGTVAAGAAAGVATVGLGAALVVGGGSIAIGGLGFGLPVWFSKGSGPRMGHNQYEKQTWNEAMRQLGIEDKDLIKRLHYANHKKPYAENLKKLLKNLKEILEEFGIKH